MSLHTGKVFLSIILSFILILNPLVASAAPNYSGSARPGHLLSGGENSLDNTFHALAGLFGSMLAGNPLSDHEALPKAADGEGLLDPLMETAGNYFAGVLEDEEIEEMLNNILEDIMSDERIAGFDQDAIIVKILRDERLAEILGDAIATYLKDEELLNLVTWFTDEITRLLTDERFASYIRDSIKDFLGDERIVQFIQGILEILIEVPEAIIENLRNDERLGQVLTDLVDLIVDSVSSMMSDLMEDDRVTGAIDSIIKKLEDLPEDFIEALLNDAKFSESLNDLKEAFMEPLEDLLDTLLERITEDEILNSFVKEILELLESDESFIDFMDILRELRDDLQELVEQIGAEVEMVMDYYADGPGGGDGDGEGEKDIIEYIMDEGPIEAQIADFFNYWAEMAGEFFGDRMEDLEEVLDKYVGEESAYLEKIIKLVSDNAENSLEIFQEEIEPVLDDHISDYPIDDILKKYEGDERIAAILEDTIDNASFEELLSLIEEKEELFIEILNDIIATLPLDTIVNGVRNGEDMNGILDDIILELPYDAIAELLGDEEIDQIIEGILGIINDLPLDNLASFLRENADYIGHTAADTILNGIADGIEFPSPPDPRRDAIMESLRSEERMRQYYIDLGADPETLTPESDTASVIIGIIMDAIEKNDRMDKFRENVEIRSEPVTEELNEYGVNFGARLRYYLGRVFSPVKRYFDPIRRLFGYEREEGDLLSNILKSAGLSGAFRWVGGFSTDVLTESGAAGILSGTMADFLLNYGVVEDVATFERFSVINNFLAEMEGAEELKQLSAERFASDFIEGVEEGVINMRDMVGLISPAEIASRINDAVFGIIPDEPLHLSIEDAGLEADDIISEISDTLEEQIPEVRKLIDELVIPSLGIPLEFLDDERTREALEEILEFSAKPVVDIMGNVLKDPRLTAIISDLLDDLMELTPQLIGDLGLVFEDERTTVALENLIINNLTDEAVLSSIGELVGDILSDEELLSIIEEALHNSIAEVTYGERGFPFKTVYVNIIGVPLIPVEVENFEVAGYNGLYYFSEVLMEWLRGQSPELSPSDFLRQYPLDYLSEDRVRQNIAEPAASLAVNVIGDIATNPDLYGLIYDGVKNALAEDPLGTVGAFIQNGRMTYLLGKSLAGFPVSDLVESLRGSGLKDLAGEMTAQIPLEELVPFVKKDKNIRGIIEDTSITIDPSPLRALLPIDAGIPAIVLNRMSDFPAGILTGFFRENDRAYRMGYTLADVEARFAVDLLENPDLAQFQRDIILEKLAEADYTLAESLFKGIATFTGNEKLADFTGELFAGLFEDIYKIMQDRVRAIASMMLNFVKNTFTGLFPVFMLLPAVLRKPGLNRRRRNKK